MNEPSGVLIVDKHTGLTSHDIVGKIRRLYNTRKVGHTGTLDPDASGVLVVLIGRAAKAAEYLVSDTKKYRALLRLGITTDTEDASGNTLTECDAIPDADAVISACENFVGNIKQIPPMYSALKKDGQKLCDLARRGITVEREARDVTVYELICTPTDEPREYILDVFCSSGTYIRTLCHDIGAKLGCGGTMASLRRTESGSFTLNEAYTIEELEGMSEDERYARLCPTESLFADRVAVTLPAFYARLSRNGAEIYLNKIGQALSEGTPVSLYDSEGFYGIGVVRAYPDGLAIRTEKLFVL